MACGLAVTSIARDVGLGEQVPDQRGREAAAHVRGVDEQVVELPRVGARR